MGEVLSVELGRKQRNIGIGPRHRQTYRPLVKFTDGDGLTHMKKTDIASQKFGYAVGTQVRILFNHQNPKTVRVNTFFSLWGKAAMHLILGLVFSVSGALFLRRTKTPASLHGQT
ncbi:MAG: DUF3592 domain-containing protein [Pikeienuella sp.]